MAAMGQENPRKRASLMEKWKTTLVMIALIPLLVSLATDESMAEPGVVKGWMKTGTDPKGYSIGTEETEQGVVAYIQSKKPKPLKYGVLMQRFESDNYKGKRMRMSARLKAVNVKDFSGMWLRVDSHKKIVAFDNMMDRSLIGTTEWQAHSIVLDIPIQSDLILMGLALMGEGKVYWDDLKWEEVGPDVPVTGSLNPLPEKEPTNLDFEG